MINKIRSKITHYGTVSKNDFARIIDDPESLWGSLIQNGYINENGVLQNKLKEVGIEQIELDRRYQNKKQEIFDVLYSAQNKATIKEWVESIVIAFILAIFIRTFIIQAFKIPTGSMRMTLIEGDRILVNKLPYGPKIPFTKQRLPGFSQPKRGDVVVFVYPEDHKRDFIKRLIAVGGETVEIRNYRIYINGQLTHIKDPTGKDIDYYNRDADYGRVNQVIKVPKDSYYVLGDNSPFSKDSRYWGFVPQELVIGKAELIYWPPQRIRIIK